MPTINRETELCHFRGNVTTGSASAGYSIVISIRKSQFRDFETAQIKLQSTIREYICNHGGRLHLLQDHQGYANSVITSIGRRSNQTCR
jgi:hypothetical protein